MRSQRSRKQSAYRNELDLLSRGQSDPYKVTVLGDRGGEVERKLAVHPLADLIPVMADSDLERFLDDVKANGVNDPIILFEGKVLDGKHRLWAAKRLGKPLRIREFKGDDAAARTYVFSANIYRRHLTGAQILAIAAKSGIIADAKVEAEAARIAGGSKGGSSGSIDPLLPGNGSSPSPTPEVPTSPQPVRWEDRAAEKLGGLVSPKTIRRFDDAKVADAPETMAKIEAGELKQVSKAVDSAASELGIEKPDPIPKSTLSRLSAATYAIRKACEELEGQLAAVSQGARGASVKKRWRNWTFTARQSIPSEPYYKRSAYRRYRVDLTLQDKNELLKAAFRCTDQAIAAWLVSIVEKFDQAGGKRAIACPQYIIGGNGSARRSGCACHDVTPIR